MKKDNTKTLLIVWVNYKVGFLYHNTYIKVTEKYDLHKVLSNFAKDLERYDKITNYCIINIMEV